MFGTRPVMMVASLMTAVLSVVCSFLNNQYAFLVVYGVLQGQYTLLRRFLQDIFDNECRMKCRFL